MFRDIALTDQTASSLQATARPDSQSSQESGYIGDQAAKSKNKALDGPDLGKHMVVAVYRAALTNYAARRPLKRTAEDTTPALHDNIISIREYPWF